MAEVVVEIAFQLVINLRVNYEGSMVTQLVIIDINLTSPFCSSVFSQIHPKIRIQQGTNMKHPRLTMSSYP